MKMNEVIKCMMDRRSIRKYRPDQISAEELDTILAAGMHSPTAGDRQTLIIAACQNREINDELGRISRSLSRARISTATSYVSKDQPGIADNPSIESGFYGAPTVLTLFGPDNFLFSQADCFIAAHNMSLAAFSIGVGSCIISRAAETFSSEPGKKLQKEWGIDEDFEAQVHLVLGYIDGEYPPPKPRKGNRVRKIA